jgi:orotidine-5'-phosphate decarboxylase
MSIDVLQEKIRKSKNPSMLSLELPYADLPPYLLAGNENLADAYGAFCMALLEGLADSVPAVRVHWGMFTLLGTAGMTQLKAVLQRARDLGYYVLLDGLDFSSAMSAQNAADLVFGGDQWSCDAVAVPAYLGSDCIKPFLPYCKDLKKDIFVQAKTSNKSAPELQDLHSGSRLVHMASMDLVNRYGQPMLGKFSYSHVAASVGAASPDAIRTLRSKYPRTFLLTDGYDYPNGNAKNCSCAFDRMGHGAIACVGGAVTAAWKLVESSDGTDFVEQAKEAALRMKKNLTRYVTIL